jgi:hypothetical protein
VEKIPEKAGLKKNTKIKRYNKEAFYQLNQKNLPIGGLVMVLST